MSKSSNSLGEEKFKSKIGGQAVIEGVMMRGIHTASMANRLPNGEIDLETWPIRGGNDLPWYRKVPFIRGVFSFGISLIDGYKCLMRAADKQMTDDGEEEPSRFEKWIEEKLGDKLMPVISFISIVLGLGLAILLFMLVPSLILKLLGKFFEMPMIVKNIIEGILKIAIFIGYTALTGLSKDMRRLYEYHGAEHKTIACHEAELPLTVENVRKQTRFHKRCGTSFIFIVLIISILVMCLVPFTITWQRIVASLALLPVVVGLSYECIRLAGNNDNIFTRILSAPGLAMQRITTREPDDSMIEIAIAAMKPCIPENKEEDRW